VYLSQGQLLPVDRVTEYFRDQVGIPLSAGSVVNFNREAYNKLETFEAKLKQALIECNIINADETGININGKRVWLHGNGNEKYTFLTPHKKRGQEAMEAMGVLPYFKGNLCHDHWKSYFRYKEAIHCLCNAHHLRELEGVWEKNDKQEWAKKMQKLLLEMNETVDKAGGVLEKDPTEKLKIRYRKILEDGELESPPPKPRGKGVPKKRGRLKRTEARNLLERLGDFEDETLRFITVLEVPFTNNLGERDIRMTKVQQKISGCFRSWEGAETFCRVRSYLATSKKNGVSGSQAMTSLFAVNLQCPIFGPE
jgi:transposase